MTFDETFIKSFRAQLWSFDVVFSLVLFSVAVTILTFTWFNLNNQLSLGVGNGPTLMQLQQRTLTLTLMSTGSPPNWQSLVNTTNTLSWNNVSIGIAQSQGTGVINPNKLYTLMSMAAGSYAATKLPLGVGFDYYITITTASGAPGLNITIGKNPLTNNALTTYTGKTSAFINGVPVIVQTTLWTNTTIGTS